MLGWLKHKLRIRKYVRMVKEHIVENDYFLSMNHVPATYYDEVYKIIFK